MISEGSSALYQLREALRMFYEDYAATLDSSDLKIWVNYFTDDAMYQVISRESYSQGLTHATIYCDGIAMIRDRATLIEEVAVFEPRTLRHFITSVRIQAETAEKLDVTANFLVVESLFDAEPRVILVGEYVDEVVRLGSAFQFRKRLAVYDQYRIQNTLVMPV